MAAGLQDGTVLVFGTGALTTYGVLQSVSVTDNVETAEAKGPDGHVTSIQQYNDTQELTLNYYQLSTSTGDPAVGTLFEYPASSGNNWVIKSIGVGNTVDGFQTVDVTATLYTNLPA